MWEPARLNKKMHKQFRSALATYLPCWCACFCGQALVVHTILLLMPEFSLLCRSICVHLHSALCIASSWCCSSCGGCGTTAGGQAGEPALMAPHHPQLQQKEETEGAPAPALVPAAALAALAGCSGEAVILAAATAQSKHMEVCGAACCPAGCSCGASSPNSMQHWGCMLHVMCRSLLFIFINMSV